MSLRISLCLTLSAALLGGACTDDPEHNDRPRPRISAEGTVERQPDPEEPANNYALIGAAVTLEGGGSFDTQGDDLTLSWAVAGPDGSNPTLTTDGTTATVTADTAGVHTVTLTASDGELEASADWSFIARANIAPTAAAGDDFTAPLGVEFQLDGTQSADSADDETLDDALTYAWKIFDPAGDEVTDDAGGTTSVAPRFTPDTEGDYRAELVVNDGFENSTADEVVITVRANSVPVADVVRTASGVVDTAIALDGAASSDADADDILTFAWSLTAPDGTNATDLLSDETVASPSFTPTAAGMYVATLVVSDGLQESEPDHVFVTVTAQ